MKRAMLALLLSAVLWMACTDTQLSEVPADVEVVPAFPGLSFTRPVDIQQPPDGTNRLFILEQAGVMRVFEQRPDASEAPVVLDIRDRVDDSSNEMGLLGLAFHPDFENNRYFYVNYTTNNPRRTVIARYEIDEAGTASVGSETVLLEVEQPFGNHNAGQLQFGPDGYLYIGFGDGGAGGDPRENGQDLSTLLGSLIRIDVDQASGGRPYAIPSDNPFVGRDGAREEIWAYGLRNPWRFSFDSETGRLWVGDVGQNSMEEVDIVEAGKNYGWNTMEASRCFDPSSGCDREGLVLPVAEYPHSQGQSVTGGYVYRGSQVPELSGKYLYADYVSGRIWALPADTDGSAEPELIADTSLAISTFGQDRDGEVYLAAFDGKIYRFGRSE